MDIIAENLLPQCRLLVHETLKVGDLVLRFWGYGLGGFDYALSGIADVAARSPDSFRTSPNALRRCRPRSQSVGTDKSPCAHADSNGPHSGPNYIRAGPNHKNLSDAGHQLTGGGVKV